MTHTLCMWIFKWYKKISEHTLLSWDDDTEGVVKENLKINLFLKSIFLYSSFLLSPSALFSIQQCQCIEEFIGNHSGIFFENALEMKIEERRWKARTFATIQ